MAAEGLSAPAGYRWCRDRAGTWHVLRVAELTHAGRPRTTARSVCGRWASLPPEPDGWVTVERRIVPGPAGLCAACLAAVAAAQRRTRAVAPSMAPGRLL